MTNDYEIVLPLMLTTVIANLVARRIEPDSLYSGWLRRRGERIQQGTDRDLLAGLQVADAFDPAPAVVGEQAPLDRLLDHLGSGAGSDLPVVDEDRRLVGIITLSDLGRLARERRPRHGAAGGARRREPRRVGDPGRQPARGDPPDGRPGHRLHSGGRSGHGALPRAGEPGPRARAVRAGRRGERRVPRRGRPLAINIPAMPALNLDALFRGLAKGEIAPVYYLHGPEEILKDEAVRAILDRALDPAFRDFNLDQRSAAQLDPDDLFALCTTLPMMAERRVVVLRDVEAAKRKPKLRAALLRYLGRPAPETVLLLVQGAGEETEDKEIARHSSAVALEPLPADRVRKWLQRRATMLGLSLDEDASGHLLAAVGGELAPLASELEKLAALPPGEPLTAARIGELVGVRHGETVFDWRDAVLDDRTGPAVALLGPLLDQPGASGVKLVTLLGTTAGRRRARRGPTPIGGSRGRALDDAVFERSAAPGSTVAELGRGEGPLGPLGCALAGGAAAGGPSGDAGRRPGAQGHHHLGRAGHPGDAGAPAGHGEAGGGMRMLRWATVLALWPVRPASPKPKPTLGWSPRCAPPRKARATRRGPRSSACSIPPPRPTRSTPRSSTPRRWWPTTRPTCGARCSGWRWSIPRPAGAMTR